MNKFPYLIKSTTHTADKTIEKTQLDRLVWAICKATHNNVAANILDTVPVNSTANQYGIIEEDLVDCSAPIEIASYRRVLGGRIDYFFYDTMGGGNVFRLPDLKVAIVDGFALLPSQALSDKQKVFFEGLIKREANKIVQRIPQFT